MKLEEAKIKLRQIENIPLRVFINEDDFADIIRAKGRTGQLLELAIGLNNGGGRLDFEDGELKTNKCDRNGNPKETVFITQISGMIDDLITGKPFYESIVYQKIKNLLYVPICKDSQDPREWYFMPNIHANFEDEQFIEIITQIKHDYELICSDIVRLLNASPTSFIHTSGGEYIQIRTKDGIPYNPIYSNVYNRYISNKNYAFYFKKRFVYALKEAGRRI